MQKMKMPPPLSLTNWDKASASELLQQNSIQSLNSVFDSPDLCGRSSGRLCDDNLLTSFDFLDINSPRGSSSTGLSYPFSPASNQATPNSSGYQFDNQQSRFNFPSSYNVDVPSPHTMHNFETSVSSSTPTSPSLFPSRPMRTSTSYCSGSSNTFSNLDYDQQSKQAWLFRNQCRDNALRNYGDGSSPSSVSDQNLNNLLNCLSLNSANEELQRESLHPLSLASLLQSPSSNSFLNSLLNTQQSTGNLSPITSLNNLSLNNLSSNLDLAAKFHRNSTANNEATTVWSGVLPTPKRGRISGYSTKVFVGGVPWGTSEEALVMAFRKFGTVRVEWPGKDKDIMQPKGYNYIILEEEARVLDLLSDCSYNPTRGYFYRIASKTSKPKEVQIIPWCLNDSTFVVSCTNHRLDATKTVFVGALHGMLNAEGLATVMDDLFQGVLYVGIDTDKHKYPIGSARVTFDNEPSYFRAVNAAFVEIKTPKFKKKIQIDPYLEESPCNMCKRHQGLYFCRSSSCFSYFCRQCWTLRHGTTRDNGEFSKHKPLCRTSKWSSSGGTSQRELQQSHQMPQSPSSSSSVPSTPTLTSTPYDYSNSLYSRNF